MLSSQNCSYKIKYWSCGDLCISTRYLLYDTMFSNVSLLIYEANMHRDRSSSYLSKGRVGFAEPHCVSAHLNTVFFKHRHLSPAF